MKNVALYLLITMLAISFAGCGGTAENKPVNTANGNANSNTAKPIAAAPTKEVLLDMDKKAHEAWAKGDTAYFEGILSDKFVAYNNGTRMNRADEIKMISAVKCEAKTISLDEAEMSKINDDTYAVTYKSTFDGTCTFEGKTEKVPSPTRATTVWVRNGDKWQAAFHGATPIVDPGAPPPPPAKEEPKKEEAKPDDKAAANSNTAAPAKPTPSTNTDALVKLHTGGWEAWKANDAKWFNDHLTASAALVNTDGNYVSGKAELVKIWTDATLCEGVTKITVGDGFASAISPTLELLTLKGQSDGKCGGQSNTPQYQSVFYVKEGDAWKLAFMFASPAR